MDSEDIDSPIELRAGEGRLLRLAGFGTAGYKWTAEVLSGPGIAEVEAVGIEAPEGEGIGASGAEMFSIRAERPGKALVHFSLRRPWEPEAQAPEREHSVEVHVT